jgi:pyrroloquinoline-quinone synthase
MDEMTKPLNNEVAHRRTLHYSQPAAQNQLWIDIFRPESAETGISTFGNLPTVSRARILKVHHRKEMIMTTQELFQQLDARIAKYDLLCHPFYKAWAAGSLTCEDLREYAQDYYHHVEAFPTYLAEFGIRLDEGDLRRAVLANMSDEKGAEDAFGEPAPAHSELWMDFARGMGSKRSLTTHRPLKEIIDLMAFFHRVASDGTPEEALAAFYAYESQVPRVAAEKARGLKENYGADERTTAYFTLHTTADVYHSQIWKQQLANRIKLHPELAEKALDSAETAAQTLWHALDGIEARRTTKAA